MNSRDFCYWLQGYCELADPENGLTAWQLECLKRHLAMVFRHEIDPSFGGPEKQKALGALHGNPAPFDPTTKIRC